jgi:hypothetical protein
MKNYIIWLIFLLTQCAGIVVGKNHIGAGACVFAVGLIGSAFYAIRLCLRIKEEDHGHRT